MIIAVNFLVSINQSSPILSAPSRYISVEREINWCFITNEPMFTSANYY